MLVAGIGLFLNTRPTSRTPYLLLVQDYGFPLSCYEYIDASMLHTFHFKPAVSTDYTHEWKIGTLTVDIVVWLISIIGTATFCEYFIRRREDRKP